MRIAHVAPTALSEISAAWRIKNAQRSIGLDAMSVVQIGERSQHTFTFDQSIELARIKKRFYERIDSIPLRMCLKRKRELPWSAAWTGRSVSRVLNKISPDIANFHWLTNGSVSLRDLRNIQCPVVLTLHDVWAFTGGCHCNLECDGWRRGCVQCPQVGRSVIGTDIVHLLRQHKVSMYEAIPNLTVVSPSRWLARMASESGCFSGRRIVTVPNCVNLDIFRPGDKFAARDRLGLPSEKIILGFGAVNATSVTYKGYDLLIQAIQLLRQQTNLDIHLVVFGADSDGSTLSFEASFLGAKDNEHELAEIYQACDIFLSPSRQDNFPSTVVEATACGTPVVAFDIGGISEIVKHTISGYLARPFDVVDFAFGIRWLLEAPDRALSAGRAAASFTSEYCSPKAVAEQYREVYESLV